MIVVNGMIEMEQNEPGSLAAVGDSCAETGRAIILGYPGLYMGAFITSKGFIRHPRCSGVPQWDEADFSNDQLLPLMMATHGTDVGLFRIKGTKTLLSLGAQLIKYRAFALLAKVNYVQSLLAPSPADCLNMVIIHVYLRKLGVASKLAMTTEKLMSQIEAYYRPEPQSQWLVDLYRAALNR